MKQYILALVTILSLFNSADIHASVAASDVYRVTTIAPFPRGLVIKDGKLYVLCRGRVRGVGGVTAEVEDQAGTIYAVNPNVTEPISTYEVSDAVRHNGEILALPTSPPFNLWDRTSNPPSRDRYTDRPYCTLRYHEGTKSFYLCAFSGVDKMKTATDKVAFSKNLTDAVLRYDLRTRKWSEVERHKIEAGGNYPHHDPRYNPPPHGWLNGADNCLPLGNTLYAVAKDNTVLISYDLTALAKDPDAPAPPSRLELSKMVPMADGSTRELYGFSALAYHKGWLYIACRTSSVIFRLRLDEQYQLTRPIAAEVVATFKPYDPATGKSANITDMDIDDQGRLYVINAKPSRVYRFTPDPANPFDGQKEEPWADMATLTHNQSMKSENVLYHDGWLYVTSGDGYSYQAGANGTVYRVAVND